MTIGVFMNRTFNISNHFITALVNSDESGLEASDSIALNEFVVRNKIKHTICPDNTETNFSRDQVTGLMSDCLEVTCEINEEDDFEELAKTLALAIHLDCSMDEATTAIGNNDYSVLTDDEADDAAAEYILDSVWAFNPSFLSAHISSLDEDDIELIQQSCESSNKALVKLIDDVDHFIKDAISSDGRGHFLSSYDGEENEVTVAGVTYYIYRIN
jgi:hypothetical protein